MESADFSINAQNVILRAFDGAVNALDDEWKRESERYKKAIAEAYKVEEAEGSFLSQEWDLEEDLYRQRKQGVGALARFPILPSTFVIWKRFSASLLRISDSTTTPIADRILNCRENSY
jgi:hypothetical protein